MYKEVEENIISMNNQTGNLHRQMDFSKTGDYNNQNRNLLVTLDYSLEVTKKRRVNLRIGQ